MSLHEECDDQNANDNDGCSNCLTDHGFTCTGYPLSTCVSSCGDGEVASDEICDVGNNLGASGCKIGCKFFTPGYICSGEPSVCMSLCGNGLNDTQSPDYFEYCDDSNLLNNDGCS